MITLLRTVWNFIGRPVSSCSSEEENSDQSSVKSDTERWSTSTTLNLPDHNPNCEGINASKFVEEYLNPNRYYSSNVAWKTRRKVRATIASIDYEAGDGVLHCWVDGARELDVYFNPSSSDVRFSASSLEELCLGDDVFCDVDREGDHTSWRATNVEKIDPEWETDVYVEDKTLSPGAATLSDNVVPERPDVVSASSGHHCFQSHGSRVTTMPENMQVRPHKDFGHPRHLSSSNKSATAIVDENYRSGLNDSCSLSCKQVDSSCDPSYLTESDVVAGCLEHSSINFADIQGSLLDELEYVAADNKVLNGEKAGILFEDQTYELALANSSSLEKLLQRCNQTTLDASRDFNKTSIVMLPKTSKELPPSCSTPYMGSDDEFQQIDGAEHSRRIERGRVQSRICDTVTLDSGLCFNLTPENSDYDIWEGDLLECQVTAPAVDVSLTRATSSSEVTSYFSTVIGVRHASQRPMEATVTRVYRCGCVLNDQVWCPLTAWGRPLQTSTSSSASTTSTIPSSFATAGRDAPIYATSMTCAASGDSLSPTYPPRAFDVTAPRPPPRVGQRVVARVVSCVLERSGQEYCWRALQYWPAEDAHLLLGGANADVIPSVPTDPTSDPLAPDTGASCTFSQSDALTKVSACDAVRVREEEESLHQLSDLLNNVTIKSPGIGLDAILGSEIMVKIVICNKNHNVSSRGTVGDQNVSDDAKLLFLKSVEFPTTNTSGETPFKLHIVEVPQSGCTPALQSNSIADSEKNLIFSGDCQQSEAVDVSSRPPSSDDASVSLELNSYFHQRDSEYRSETFQDDSARNYSVHQTDGHEISVSSINDSAAPVLTDLNCKNSSIASRPSVALPATLIPGREVYLGVKFTASTLGYTRQKCLLTFVQDCDQTFSNSDNDLNAEIRTRGTALDEQGTRVMNADPPSVVMENDPTKFETPDESWLSLSETSTSQKVDLPLPRSNSLLEASIGVFLEVNVLDPQQRELLQQIAPSNATRKENCSEALGTKSASLKEEIIEDLILRGPPLPRPPAFSPNRLAQYPVPQRLWAWARHEEGAPRQAPPLLQEPLGPSNYSYKMALLLHLEEIALTFEMEKYRLERAHFSPALGGEYLSLEVAGLSDKRPSLLVGDTLLALPPRGCGEGEEAVFEGCIHHVLNNKVLLKFHPSFHASYDGADYAVEFRINRTPLRRGHQAVWRGMMEWPHLLFPDLYYRFWDDREEGGEVNWVADVGLGGDCAPVSTANQKDVGRGEGDWTVDKGPDGLGRNSGTPSTDNQSEDGPGGVITSTIQVIGGDQHEVDGSVMSSSCSDEIVDLPRHEGACNDISTDTITDTGLSTVLRGKCLNVGDISLHAGGDGDADNVFDDANVCPDVNNVGAITRDCHGNDPNYIDSLRSGTTEVGFLGGNTCELAKTSNDRDHKGNPYICRPISDSDIHSVGIIVTSVSAVNRNDSRKGCTVDPSNHDAGLKPSTRGETVQSSTKTRAVASGDSELSKLSTHSSLRFIPRIVELKHRNLCRNKMILKATKQCVTEPTSSLTLTDFEDSMTLDSSKCAAVDISNRAFFKNIRHENVLRSSAELVSINQNPSLPLSKPTSGSHGNGSSGISSREVPRRTLDSARQVVGGLRGCGQTITEDSSSPTSKDLVSTLLKQIVWVNSVLNPEQKRCVAAVLALSYGGTLLRAEPPSCSVRSGSSSVNASAVFHRPLQPSQDGARSQSGLRGNIVDSGANPVDSVAVFSPEEERPPRNYIKLPHIFYENTSSKPSSHINSLSDVPTTILNTSRNCNGNIRKKQNNDNTTHMDTSSGRPATAIIIQDSNHITSNSHINTKSRDEALRSDNINYVFDDRPQNIRVHRHNSGRWDNSTTNEVTSQDSAAPRLPFLLHGPPGTGKSVTLVEAALQLLRQHHRHRVLIVTPSNSASDLLATRLLQAGLPQHSIVRLNAFQRAPSTLPDALAAISIDGGALPRRPPLVLVATATTASALHHHRAYTTHFTHLLVDEAGQLTEPETGGAMGLVPHGVVVLCGDPGQLGPVVASRAARKGGLHHSLLHRLSCSPLYAGAVSSASAAATAPGSSDQLPPSSLLAGHLVRNYRSHPAILHIFSHLFYTATLLSERTPQDTEWLQMLSWPELVTPGFPVVFHGIVGENLQEGDSPSWFNPAEAFQCVRYARSLLNHGVRAEDIGIIAPYRKQVCKIRGLLEALAVPEEVRVGSVEEFQGQERAAIIVSAVRSKRDKGQSGVHPQLGFVCCRRRLNVALSRARSLLVVVADGGLLGAADPNWGALLRYCVDKGGYRGAPLPR